MTSMVLNQELNGVEIYFGEKPVKEIISNLKSVGFHWNGKKLCWYAKQSEQTITEAQKYINDKKEIEYISVTEVKKEVVKKNNIISLWGLTRIENVIGNTNLSTKEIASEVRKIVKKRFPFVKFSITSDYSSIHFYIVSSPFERDSIYLTAIMDYCTALLKAYNYCTCYDPYGDYGSSYNFYGAYARIDYGYQQTEVTETIINMITEFDNKNAEFIKLEEEKKEKEYQEYLKKQEEDHKQYELRQQEEAKQIKNIYNSIDIKDLEDNDQYFVIGSQFANLNKNCTLEEYKEEIAKDKYTLENVKITREIHFNNIEALNNFSNLLLKDFTFLEQTGGSYTDDVRVNSMIDYDNMDKEERETVQWNLHGVAVYCNNELQFVIDTQGFSYARYVGLVDNVKIEKVLNSNQCLDSEELEELKSKADCLTDMSTDIIINNNMIKTWNNENWNEYKGIIKTEFKNKNFKLTKAIIQQLDSNMEEFKTAMYKLLKEVDGIQEQFKNAELQQGQKITMFYISDWGGIVKNRVIFNSVEYTNYAQYDNAVKVTFTPEGKRKQYYNYWYGTMLVYNGWLELPDSVLNEIETNNNFIIKKSKYTSCDNRQYDEILSYFESIGIKPLVNTYKPTF